MTSEKDIDRFIMSQKSLQFYSRTRKALKDVLLRLSDKEYEKATGNTIIMAMHEGALGQVMHFPGIKGRFQILQLTLPDKVPINVLRYLMAHELGHILQGRNWEKSDNDTLETDADEKAEKWGFPRTRQISRWIENHRS